MRLPNNYGSVHKLSGTRRNPWRVRKQIGKTEEGKPIYANIGYYPTRTKALEALAEYNKNPYDLKNDKLTFEDIYKLMLEREEQKLSVASLKNMSSLYKHLEPIHKMNIKDIRTLHLQNVIDDMTVGFSMKKKTKMLMNKTLGYALKNDIVEKDYSKFVELIDNGSGETREATVFSFEEINEVFNQDTFEYDVAKILLCTGYRINELLSIRTENIYLEEDYLIAGSKTKAGKDRIVPISKHIKSIIEKYYDNNNEFLFMSKRGKRYPYSTYNDKWMKILPNHTPHDTRHTFISIMDNVLANKVAAHRIFGHANSGVTEKVYTHKNLEDLKEVMRLFDDYLSTNCVLTVY
jgi:integrase